MQASIPAPLRRFPDQIAASAPIGMRDNVRRAAAAVGLSSAAFIRGAIEDRLKLVAQPTSAAEG